MGVAVQRLVAHAVLTEVGADLVATPLEEVPAVADLPLPWRKGGGWERRQEELEERASEGGERKTFSIVLPR